MQEKINNFNLEIDSINVVIDKLVTKQNSSVFDKLCIKCNALLDKIIDATENIVTREERQSIISVLRRLRSSAQVLSDYKSYLITAIDENIRELSSESNVVEFPSGSDLNLQNEKEKTLVLVNDNKNAA